MFCPQATRVAFHTAPATAAAEVNLKVSEPIRGEMGKCMLGRVFPGLVATETWAVSVCRRDVCACRQKKFLPGLMDYLLWRRAAGFPRSGRSDAGVDGCWATFRRVWRRTSRLPQVESAGRVFVLGMANALMFICQLRCVVREPARDPARAHSPARWRSSRGTKPRGNGREKRQWEH